jgi:SAM-dependent methyltransferase
MLKSSADHPWFVEPEQLKCCCAAFYEEPVLRRFLGNSLHPGGLRATTQLGESLDLRPGDRVLEVACGPGLSIGHLTRMFGCRMVGLDYSLRSLTEAQAQRAEEAYFIVGDGERLPFVDGEFDAVIVECSLCLFPDKATAVGEMGRVLKPGARVGVADFALERSLPAATSNLLAWAACVTGASTTDGYCQLMSAANFREISVTDASWALTELAEKLDRMSFMLDLAHAVGGGTHLPVTSAQARDFLQEAHRWITDGLVRYIFLTGRRPG